MEGKILFECVRDETGLYLEDPTPEVSFWYEMPREFWEMLIKRYKEISGDNNFTPGQQADAKNLMKIIEEELEVIEK